jgi:hypothetical protein
MSRCRSTNSYRIHAAFKKNVDGQTDQQFVYLGNGYLVHVSTGWDYVSELRTPAGLLFILLMIYEYGQPRWNDTDSGKPKNSEKMLSQCYFVTANPTRTNRGANPGHRGERPATNRLSHGTVSTGILVHRVCCINISSDTSTRYYQQQVNALNRCMLRWIICYLIHILSPSLIHTPLS